MNVRILWLSLCLVGLLLASLTGCTFWTKPVTDSFASVTITNTTYADVQAVTTQVFRDAQYKLTSIDTNTDMLVFDKQATKGQNFAYKSVFDSDSGEPIIDRVKIVLRNDLGDSTFLVCCQAYIVQDSDSALSPKEMQVSHMHRGPYQRLLDDIARQLNPPEKKK
jgi:hypothetical protein